MLYEEPYRKRAPRRRRKRHPLRSALLKLIAFVLALALIAAAGLSILRSVLFTGAPSLTGVQWLGAVLFVCALFALRKWRPSPILIMLLCGGLSLCAGICGLI